MKTLLQLSAHLVGVCIKDRTHQKLQQLYGNSQSVIWYRYLNGNLCTYPLLHSGLVLLVMPEFVVQPLCKYRSQERVTKSWFRSWMPNQARSFHQRNTPTSSAVQDVLQIWIPVKGPQKLSCHIIGANLADLKPYDYLNSQNRLQKRRGWSLPVRS